MHKNTLFIASQTDDPSFNLAAEENFLRNHEENIIFIYINRPSIIVGKHQNTLSEINADYLEENNIPVFRRLSGGGTVYHDKGNINYCIIETGDPGKLVDFVRATTPIVEALRSYGIDARHGKRNDLLVGYKKISGNACHVYKSRAMHHGTLLFNADLEHLTEGLKADASKFKDKSVKSVRSEVINISELTGKNHTVEDFMQFIKHYLINKFDATSYTFPEKDLKQIENLRNEKYTTWKWNYGYSPVYEFSKRSKTTNYIFSVKLKVEKGKITKANIKSNYPRKEVVETAIAKIEGSTHEKNEIREKLKTLDEEIAGGLLDCLF